VTREDIVPLFRGAELPDTFYSIAYIYEESPCLVTYVTKNYFTVSVKLYLAPVILQGKLLLRRLVS
jgi:hypothetical protein